MTRLLTVTIDVERGDLMVACDVLCRVTSFPATMQDPEEYDVEIVTALESGTLDVMELSDDEADAAVRAAEEADAE